MQDHENFDDLNDIKTDFIAIYIYLLNLHLRSCRTRSAHARDVFRPVYESSC